jgi:hypothetical protein
MLARGGAYCLIIRRVRWLLLVFVAHVVAASPVGQTFDFEQGHQSVSELDGKWRFHPGDNPQWAEPGFDDSAWKLLDSERSWYDQGYRGLSGMVWYRFKVKLPAGVGRYPSSCLKS